MKFVLAFIALAFLGTPKAKALPVGDRCVNAQGQESKQTFNVNKIVGPALINELHAQHPETSQMDILDIGDVGIMAHLICRLNGCTRATWYTKTSHSDKRKQGEFFIELQTVTCGHESKGSLMTPRINNSYQDFRKMLTAVERRSRSVRIIRTTNAQSLD